MSIIISPTFLVSSSYSLYISFNFSIAYDFMIKLIFNNTLLKIYYGGKLMMIRYLVGPSPIESPNPQSSSSSFLLSFLSFLITSYKFIITLLASIIEE